MKAILIPILTLLFFHVDAQSSQLDHILSDYEKFVAREGSLILSTSEEIFETGSLDRSLGIFYTEAKDVTRNGETIKAINVVINKSNAYLSQEEVTRLVNQMKKMQLLLVDGEITKKHDATFNIRNNILFEVTYSESKKTWKYSLGVIDDGRKKLKEVTSIEFQDIKSSLENQLSKL
ncbi:MAG: hypothetical protein ABJG78_17820 [Cyclobacteriaceae bacterium]